MAENQPQAVKFANDMQVFMTAQRVHKVSIPHPVHASRSGADTLRSQELFERYNPTTDMTQEERAQKSARLVGLNMPKTFDPSDQ